MNRFKKPIGVIILVLIAVILGGVVNARASIDGDIGIRWWRMNQAHEGAEIARALGGDNSAALAYFGERWTTANNERKELEASRRVSLGTFKITHYCPCAICNGSYAGKPTALGTTLTPYRTIAVDPRVIPLGTHVIINGQEYIAEDTGGAIKGNRIDLCVATHSEALAKGVIDAEVWRVNG